MGKLIYVGDMTTEDDKEKLRKLEEALVSNNLGNEFPEIDIVNVKAKRFTEEYIEEICKFLGDVIEGKDYKEFDMAVQAAYLLRKFEIEKKG